ncbi:hypothetical protein [Spirosoma montaniterrae]|uniref:O-antigen polymerase n=1 Tax=Spirosoma montaniterrae TaxID=1178516 RepID=A0A1P9X1C2_9BACT|nr:hypothetical protein [Spirosoma montaniterrae]AQG81398.1 hypothetical protein AWR27_19975 [Spirosoma montaniterrae]
MNSHLFLIGILFAVSVRLFSFSLIDDIYFDALEAAIVLVLIWYNVSHPKRIRTPFVFYVKAIIILSLLSAIPAFLFHDQNFALSLLTSRVIFFWLLYFALHKMNVDPYKLEKLLIIFGVAWSIIMVVQQFTYPTVLFDVYHGVTYEDGKERNVDIRGGIVRIWIAGVGFSYFLATYMWQKIYEKLSLSNIALFALVIAAILLMQSRQVIFGLILVFTADVFLNFKVASVKRIRFTTLFFGFALVFFAVAGDFILALIELSKEQGVTSGDYVRALEINYFLFEYWPHPLCYLLGNGWEHDLSPYGKEIKEQLKWGLGLYRSDVGLIGAFNKFGLFYVVVVIMFYAKVLIPRKHLIIPRYIRLCFVLCALTAFTGANFFETPSYFVPFACLFYITDKANEYHLHHHTHSQPAVAHTEGHPVAV